MAAGRYAAVDVHYPPAGGARAAAVVASDPTFATVVAEHISQLSQVEPYQPDKANKLYFQRR